ncbi:MFS transporter [Mycobacterium sp. 852013-50091_SCH5140682]|uniref:MFS transporter n=1 Tax=Mycobacterium sp. 852013-50091_SCH5140682 TaxID=1834109 RepID=UPI0007E96FDC|nr:MFS transporter [Mycobacterium sp. 852013-50091_SCH5140682]OBC09198.1 MFS transporter [Mycobacterium sp. 852013-50091_SCH5140682]
MTDVRSAGPPDPALDDGTPLGLAALLAGTVVGTLSNNVVNVPLNAIIDEFGAPLGNGVFVVVGFLVCFAATIPLAGWFGDRFGRRRIYCMALLATAVCAVGAATAPTLPLLIAWRAAGGVAAAAFAPAVMGLIAWMFSGQSRGRAMGAWASANGIGQAIGPSLGGLVADHWGWRWVFVPLVPVALAGFVGTLRYVPRYPGTRMRFDLAGASALTIGSALLMLGLALVSQPDVTAWFALGVVVIAVVVLAWFAWHCTCIPNPFVDVRLVTESRFARSAVAAFAQMFCLGAALLAVPLYLVGNSVSISAAGIALFTVPAAMAILGPGVGRWQDRLGPRRVMRTGLVLLLIAQVGLAVTVAQHRLLLPAMVAVLVAAGVGISLVQTPAATGATRAPAGERGTGLGLFNLVRFGGSACGAAWVAVALDISGYPLVFIACAVIVTLGLAGSFLGPDPAPV